MTGQILFLIIITFGLSCNSISQEKIYQQNIKISEGIGTEANILFAFTVKRINASGETIEINGSLLNNNIDTVNFLSSSCNGEQYSLRYDTSKFVLSPFYDCNASFTRLIKIAPKEKYDFKVQMRCLSKETKIKLGFDFYSVDKSFNLTNKKLGDINIFNRPEDKQTIIWADEMVIN
jgi:hypothetical protein